MQHCRIFLSYVVIKVIVLIWYSPIVQIKTTIRWKRDDNNNNSEIYILLLYTLVYNIYIYTFSLQMKRKKYSHSLSLFLCRYIYIYIFVYLLHSSNKIRKLITNMVWMSILMVIRTLVYTHTQKRIQNLPLADWVYWLKIPLNFMYIYVT